MERGAHKANVHSKIMLALSIILATAKGMAGDNKFEVSAYARDKRVPVRFLNDIVDELTQAGYIASISEDDVDKEYVLLRPVDKLNVKEIVDYMMSSGVKPAELGLVKIDPRIEQIVKSTSDGLGGSLRTTTVQDLLGRD